MSEQITESRNEREGRYSGWKDRHRRGEGGYMHARDWRCAPKRWQIKKCKMEPPEFDGLHDYGDDYCGDDDERQACTACRGDGRDPFDYMLPCEVCCGDGYFD